MSRSMSRSKPTPPAKPADPTTEAVAAPSEAVAAPEAPAPAVDAPAAPAAVEAQPAAVLTPAEPAPQPADDGPTEPPMPKTPDEPEVELRTDGPTPSEYVAAGYSMDTYPPRGYAAKPDAPLVELYQVTENCRYVINGSVATWHKGMLIDSINFNIADVKAQGIPLRRATEDDRDHTPAIGHRSV